MDTVKILLGVMLALLLGWLVASWKGLRRDMRETPEEELARHRSRIEEIQRERVALHLQRDRILGIKKAVPEQPEEAPVVRMEDIPETGGVYAEEIAGPVEPAEPANLGTEETPEAAAGLSEAERAAMIKAAPLVAKVGLWEGEGGFAVVEILDAAAVKPGTILCIRRHTGILGRLKVSEVTPEGAAIANAMAAFPGPVPQAGDELILEPQ